MNKVPQNISICIIRLSAIGDCINTYAAIQSLRRYYPNAKITWIIGKTEAKLFEENSEISLIPYDKKQGIKEYYRLYKILKNIKFDVLLDMQSALRASLISLAVNSPIKYGFDSIRAMDCQSLFTNKKVLSPTSPHVVDGFLAFTEALGCPKTEPSWDFEFSDEENSFASKYISNAKCFIICPCSSKKYKNWHANGYIEISKYAISKGFKVLICGGNSLLEQEVSDIIIKGINNSSYALNLTGLTNIRQMLALINHASLVLAPDSGPVHMANAVNTPIIGLYAHHNPKRVGPYKYLKYCVSVYDECISLEHQDTSKLKWRTRVKDKHAMLKISSKMVREAFDLICNDFNLE